MRHCLIVVPRTGSGTNASPFTNPLPFGWQDVTGQPVADIVVSKNAYTVEAWVADALIAAIKADARYAVVWDIDAAADDQTPPALSASEKTTLQTKLSTLYYPDVAALVVKDTQIPAVILSNLVTVQKRPTWKAGIPVKLNDVYFYPVDKNLYQVIQAHTTQSDWTPPVAKALFKRFYEPSDAPWPWVQPTGGHDAYPVGAKVTYGGYTWQNTIAANVWQPGVTGWTNLTPPPVSPNWAVGVAYKVNDLVIYVPNGFTYKCLQAHTSIATWNPPAAASLWQKQ